jgi:uncharacterized repeat protein (TIGR01451 family)
VSSGLISSNAGVFTVAAGHTWSAPGTYHVGITVFDLGRAQAVQSTAVVSPPQTPPQFTAANPPLTATQVTQYLYTFAASGTPTPTFSLATGAPSWLSIGVTSGVVTGTPPIGTTSFTYSVVASNGVSPDATAGPFAVAVSASTSNKSADLSVSISAPANAAKGSTVTYSIVVSNTGPSTATNGALVLLAGPNASFVSASPNLFINIDGLWTWTFANLDAGQSATFTLRLKLTKAGTVLATAAVGADTRDPKLANNAALVRTIVK